MNSINEVKALVFDIDRTLTNYEGEVTEATLNALKKAKEKGLYTAVCSGRGYPSIHRKIMPLFDEEALHVVAGGSQVVRTNGEVLWEQKIDKTIVEEILSLTQTNNLNTIFISAHALYAYEPIYSNLIKNSWGLNVRHMEVMNPDHIALIYISEPSFEFLEYLEKHPMLDFKKMTSNSGKPYVDITAKGVNKATALQVWSEKTGIALSQVIGFGDSKNDIEFLQSCGVGVAMGNADESVKQIATKVIGHTDNNGLAEYILEITKGSSL